MKSLRIVFMGSPDFAVPSLERIHRSLHTIAAVVSHPDKRRGRRGKPVPTDVKRKAIGLGLPVIEVDDLRSESFTKELGDLNPDLFVVVAFRILPPEVLQIPPLGSVNLHASLLPKYRGAAPIHWAVINGEHETGCTIFFLDENVDTGEIIGRNKTTIGPHETTGDLYDRLKISGAELLLKSIDQIAAGTVTTIPQNHEEATPAPKLHRENTKIDFTKTAAQVHNLVRGLQPFPVAWCLYKGEKMNIHKTFPLPEHELPPGQLETRGGRLYAGCGKGAVEILELQLPGKKILSGSDFVNGYDLNTSLR